MKRDYYGVLGIGTSATPAQIRRAYQRLARQYSPDVNLWEQSAQALFEEIAEAYRVLSDPMARTLYDRGDAPSSSARPEPSGTPLQASGRRGDDLHIPIELSFLHAASGFEADVPVERLSTCGACRATGTARGAAPTPCRECAGTGEVWTGRGALERSSCVACSGSGVTLTDPCSSCR